MSDLRRLDDLLGPERAGVMVVRRLGRPACRARGCAQMLRHQVHAVRLGAERGHAELGALGRS